MSTDKILLEIKKKNSFEHGLRGFSAHDFPCYTALFAYWAPGGKNSLVLTGAPLAFKFLLTSIGIYYLFGDFLFFIS